MITVKGYIKKVRYRKEETGFTILQLMTEDGEITCVGSISRVDEGESIEVTGEMVYHPSYGEQIQIDHFAVIQPEDPESLLRYLGSGLIHGVGEALAGRIIKKFGADTMHVLENEPERLAEVKGISERKAREIAIQFMEKSQARAAFMFLQEYGISNAMAVKIYDEYGDAIYGIMRENPYRLAEDIRGISFKTADEIAAKGGIKADSQFRIKSGIMYVLMVASANGNIYLPMNLLLKNASELLGLPQEDLASELDNMSMERKIMIRRASEPEAQPQIYAYRYYYAELQCAAMLHDLNMHMDREASESEEKAINRKIAEMEKTQGIEYDDLQKQAVRSAASNGIFVLSGGPGTGKTTTINAMINYFVDEGLDIMLAAPTGRAAKRMSEATGYEAKTIHRMLEVSGLPDDDGARARFERNEDNPLEADVIIVDEMSMVDVFLFQALLKAVTPGTRLILVGDVDQLPSVGPGQVLKDVISSGAFPVVTLEHIFRQAENSDIVMNAHRIRQGQYPKLDNKSRDFFFLPRSSTDIIYKNLVTLIREKMPDYVSAEEDEIQVLTPMRKGPLGVETLNRILQKYLNPEDPGKKELESGETLFREGDKVMQIKNNYQLEWSVTGLHGIMIDNGTGVFNGDMGKIVRIDDSDRTVTVEYDECRRVQYAFSQLEELELAYAVTIHKSQGSEYPAVLMPLMPGPRQLFNRNLLYTAVTRARKCAVILGSENTVCGMVDNDHANMRYTGLKDRICEVCL